MLNGGNTGCLGVQEFQAGGGKHLRVTGVERTLIHAAVRPAYSGGLFEVARAYEASRAKASVAVLARMLETINYTYPYHQSIGYLLERAGFSSSCRAVAGISNRVPFLS